MPTKCYSKVKFVSAEEGLLRNPSSDPEEISSTPELPRDRRWPILFETGSEGPELEGLQVEMKSKVAESSPKKLIRRTCPNGHGSDGSGPKWHAPPCSESAAQRKSFRPQSTNSFWVLLQWIYSTVRLEYTIVLTQKNYQRIQSMNETK